MNSPIDFLHIRKLAKYLVLFAAILLGGFIAKDLFAVLIVAILAYFIITNKFFRSIETWLIWSFLYGFYSGQGYFTNDFISKYLAKPSFLLFVIFLFFYNTISKSLKAADFFTVWLCFLGLSLIGLFYHAQPPFVIITISSFFLIYLLFRSKRLDSKQCICLLNLFVAVAILQTIICVMQVSQLIPPPSKMMDDGNGGQFEWIAGLDDVACGTFGPVAAHLVSWYQSLIVLFCILVWSVCRKTKYLVLVIIILAQFATVDSKTIMGVMVLMMLYLLYYINKHRIKFRLNIRKVLGIAFTAVIMGVVLLQAWDFYYKYQNASGGAESRPDLNTVYKKEVVRSGNLMLDNFSDWGKFQGFRYVLEDFLYEDPLEVIWGYGLQGYTYNGKRSFIENKDTPFMQLNNFTRSRSGLIQYFAQTGLVGMILLFLSLILWSRYNIKRKNINEIDLIINSLIKIFLPFTLLCAFIYSVSLTGITVIGFAAMIGLLKKYSEIVNRKRALLAYKAEYGQNLNNLKEIPL